MNDYDLFLQFIVESLGHINDQYYQTQYHNFYAFRDSIRTLGYFRGTKFIRHSERGFAYELYFQLRLLIDAERDRQTFFPYYLLQGEIKKMNASQVRLTFGYSDLGGSLIPDLLFHIPSDNANAFVIEIKAQPELEPIELIYDLDKLLRFLRSFNYKKAAFVAVNISSDFVSDCIINNAEQIRNLFTQERLSDCSIIVKQYSGIDSPVFNQTIAEILA